MAEYFLAGPGHHMRWRCYVTHPIDPHRTTLQETAQPRPVGARADGRQRGRWSDLLEPTLAHLWNRCDEQIRVGMQRRRRQGMAVARLHFATRIQHDDLIADRTHRRDIMTDEQVR